MSSKDPRTELRHGNLLVTMKFKNEPEVSLRYTVKRNRMPEGRLVRDIKQYGRVSGHASFILRV